MSEFLKRRYALSKDVRQGAQATVTRALDSEDGALVAIKRFKFGPDDQRAREAFQREVRILQKISHENVVRLIDVDSDEDGNWFIVLEWVDDNLEDVIGRDGPISWPLFWQSIGRPLLDAICAGQSKGVAHRDIKPKNVLMTKDRVVKLADYGIGKLIDQGGAWAVTGVTFRFDYSKGYTPAKPEDERYVFSRDCFSFAAVAVSCVTGRIISNDEDMPIALQEASLPAGIRPIIESCLDLDPSQRPPKASKLRDMLDRAMVAEEERGALARLHLQFIPQLIGKLARRLDLEDEAVERFVVDELSEVCGIQVQEDDASRRVSLIGATWVFEGSVHGRHSEAVYLTQAREVGASLAATIRDQGLARSMQFHLGRPRDPERAGRELAMLLVEALAAQEEKAVEQRARSSERILRVWRGFLRDRADLETKRARALRYVDRRIAGDQVVFTTELAVGEDIVGQERLVQAGASRIGGRVAVASFNQVVMDITFGRSNDLPRRGELAINTIAAQKALSHQTQALDALVFDRAVSDRLKPIVLDPTAAAPADPVGEVVPTDEEFDGEKRKVLARALGVADILAIEGPPGTGKTKLIAEIAVQWLRRYPGHRILLSSQTHIALDNVLERVAEIDASIDLIRIGRADEPRISDASKALLLEKRVEVWIREARKKSEQEMTRWAEELGVDQVTVRTGMRVERLIKLLRRQEELRERIEEMQSERRLLDEATVEEQIGGVEETEEESTQLDSEMGELRAELKVSSAEERNVREAMREMGGYAAELADSSDHQELADWALHFLSADPKVDACRARLALLEDWHLRVGRSADFNAAVLSSAQVIAGTCVGIAGVRGMGEVAYDLCIIDEASKATPTEALVPMVRSAKWILVGDTKQLPPFFEELGEDLLAEFDDKEVKATLLDRLLDEHHGLPAESRAELRNQYRMIKPIGDLVSSCFYGGRLHSPKATHGLKLSTAFPAPVTWFSTHAKANREEERVGLTFRNQCEVQEIRQLLKRLQFAAKGQKARVSVAVIAGYTAQVELLREMASQSVAEWPDLEVHCNSVDAFQGRQADVCIYSVVRSNSRKDLGFLREQPRLNVALSRGKSALVIVGDQLFCRSAMGKNPFKPVIDYVEQHGDHCVMDTLS